MGDRSGKLQYLVRPRWGVKDELTRGEGLGEDHGQKNKTLRWSKKQRTGCKRAGGCNRGRKRGGHGRKKNKAYLAAGEGCEGHLYNIENPFVTKKEKGTDGTARGGKSEERSRFVQRESRD